MISDVEFNQLVKHISGSAHYYHPLLGKFQMSGGIPK